MKKSFCLSILVIVLFILPARAQIEKELPTSVDSTQVLVMKGRKMMIDQLNEKDYKNLRDIYFSLDDKTLEKENTPFDYTEYLYINLLLENWDVVTDYMTSYEESENIIPYPVDDPLKDILFEKVAASSDSLLDKVKNAAIDKEGKSVIELLIQLMRNNTPDYRYYRLLDQYNRKYKNTAYNDFVQYFLPAPKVKEAIGFSLGSGMIIPRGKLEESFSRRPSFCASIDMNYKKLFGSFYFQAAGLKLENPFILNVGDENIEYLKDDIFNYQDFGVKGGYLLIRSNRFQIGPYASINGIVLKTTDFDFLERIMQKAENEEDQEYKIINSFACGGGMHTEIKLFENHKENKNSRIIDRYVSLKADAGYNFITSRRSKLFEGDTWYYSIGLVFGEGYF